MQTKQGRCTYILPSRHHTNQQYDVSIYFWPAIAIEHMMKKPSKWEIHHPVKATKMKRTMIVFVSFPIFLQKITLALWCYLSSDPLCHADWNKNQNECPKHALLFISYYNRRPTHVNKVKISLSPVCLIQVLHKDGAQ